MDDDPEPKPRREIRIPIPEFDDLKAAAVKASETKENVFAAIGGWMKRHPWLTAIILVVIFQFVRALIKFPPR